MLNIGDLVTVLPIGHIPPIPSYTSSEDGYYYCISRRTLLDMSKPPNRYRIKNVLHPAPCFDGSREPVAYRLAPDSIEDMDSWSEDRGRLYFLENMLRKEEDEEVLPPEQNLAALYGM